MKKLETRAEFEEIANATEAPIVVQLEDKRMGMCNSWGDDGVLVDAYKGNELETLRIPFDHFYHLGNGAMFAGLKRAVKQGGQA